MLESIYEHRAGLLVDPVDQDALVQALITLPSNPAMSAEMGLNGRALAQQHSWEQAIESYRQVYSEI